MSRSEIGSFVGPKDEIRRVFDRFDKNGDGRISYDEFTDAIRALNPSSSSDEVKRMMQVLDKDGDGTIDFEEFASVYLTNGGDQSVQLDDLKEAFDLYDLDRDGRISARELHVALGRLGEKCTMEDCVRIIGQVDSDGDGQVSFEEFKMMMMKK